MNASCLLTRLAKACIRASRRVSCLDGMTAGRQEAEPFMRCYGVQCCRAYSIAGPHVIPQGPGSFQFQVPCPVLHSFNGQRRSTPALTARMPFNFRTEGALELLHQLKLPLLKASSLLLPITPGAAYDPGIQSSAINLRRAEVPACPCTLSASVCYTPHAHRSGQERAREGAAASILFERLEHIRKSASCRL